MAETRANQDELMFIKSEKRFLKVLLEICKTVRPEKIKSIKLRDIDIKFTRNIHINQHGNCK